MGELGKAWLRGVFNRPSWAMFVTLEAPLVRVVACLGPDGADFEEDELMAAIRLSLGT